MTEKFILYYTENYKGKDIITQKKAMITPYSLAHFLDGSEEIKYQNDD